MLVGIDSATCQNWPVQYPAILAFQVRTMGKSTYPNLLSTLFQHTAVLDTPAIIGIAAGGAGAALLLTVVCLLMLCVYRCARRGSHESECLCAGREEGGGADVRLGGE